MRITIVCLIPSEQCFNLLQKAALHATSCTALSLRFPQKMHHCTLAASLSALLQGLREAKAQVVAGNMWHSVHLEL